MQPYEKLKSIRIKKGLTTYQLSELSGISQSTISKMENGKRKIETDTLQRIAKVLNVPISSFFDEDISENKPEIQIPEEYSSKYKVTSRDKKQYLEEMKKANEAFFMDDEFNEEAKKEMLDLMSELFWEAKAMNKRKK